MSEGKEQDGEGEETQQGAIFNQIPAVAWFQRVFCSQLLFQNVSKKDNRAFIASTGQLLEGYGFASTFTPRVGAGRMGLGCSSEDGVPSHRVPSSEQGSLTLPPIYALIFLPSSHHIPIHC